MTRRTALTLAAPLLQAAANETPAPDSAGGWRVKTPAAVGLDASRLEQAFRYAMQTSQNGGLLVSRRGTLVFEKYFGKGHREAHPDMASIGKAYTSIGCGILLAEKRAEIPDGLDQLVFNEKYLPEAVPLSDPAKAGIRLGHLLSMSSGLREGNTGFVDGVLRTLDPQPARKLDFAAQDRNAVNAPMWIAPGGGYSYASLSTHAASMVLRRVAGMELQQYLEVKLARPMGWGEWGYALHRNGGTLPHTPGGGSIAVRATDALRFAHLLLRQGRWGQQQLVPADYIALCARPSKYNPHAPFSLQFEVNEGGHVIGAPRDAWFKSGAGGSAIYMVPSLDLAIYKMAGSDAQFAPELTRLPVRYAIDRSREGWKPVAHSQFHDGPIGGDDGVRRLLEFVVAAVISR